MTDINELKEKFCASFRADAGRAEYLFNALCERQDQDDAIPFLLENVALEKVHVFFGGDSTIKPIRKEFLEGEMDDYNARDLHSRCHRTPSFVRYHSKEYPGVSIFLAAFFNEAGELPEGYDSLADRLASMYRTNILLQPKGDASGKRRAPHPVHP